MEKQVTTYGDLKQRKAELRRKMVDECDYSTHIDEYQEILQRIKDAESCLLWSIIYCEPEIPVEQAKPKAYNRVKKAVAVISATIIIVILVISLFGCNLAREGLYGTGRCIGALGEDVKWTAEKLGDNITTEK